MQKLLGMLLVVAGLSTGALAGLNGSGPVAAPEIGVMTAISALTLIGGAVLVIRSRKK